jgi:hypothetical protein
MIHCNTIVVNSYVIAMALLFWVKTDRKYMKPEPIDSLARKN